MKVKHSKVTYPDGSTPSVIIIGAGFSGICAAIELKTQLGLDTFTIYDGEDQVGGTWWSNTYPGCACDVPSHLYSFSFAPKHDWNEKYSGQKEILKYLQGVAKDYGILSHVQTRTLVTDNVWDAARNGWNVTIRSKDTGKESVVFANVVISGIGALRVPLSPPEFEKFKNTKLHTAVWDPKVKLEGKRVGVIGSGASAIQLIPAIAPIVDHLYVFQRTPTWVVPRSNFKYWGAVKWLFEHVPGATKLHRYLIFLRNEFAFFATFRRDSAITKVLSTCIKAYARFHLRRSVPNVELRKKLTPEYDMGCKRIVVADDYYPALSRSNVTVSIDKITEVGPKSVTTSDGKKTELDVLVLATGFKVGEVDMHLTGTDGHKLHDKWNGTPQGYLGICQTGFPNYFMLLGPNTGLGHNSVVFMIECQAKYITELIRGMMQRNVASVDVKEEAQESFIQALRKNIQRTVFVSQCKSWYENKAGQVFALWSGNCTSYWRQTRIPKFADFFVSSK